jgi:hypothetical protein
MLITGTRVCNLLDLDLDLDPDVDLHLDLDLDLQTCIRDADMDARDIQQAPYVWL